MLDDLEKQLTELDELVTNEALDNEDLGRLAKELVQARELVRVVRDIAGRIEQGVARAMANEKKIVVEGVGTLERNIDISRKEWDHKLLASKLVANALVKYAKENGGEMLDESTAQVVLEAIEKSCRTEWRVTGLAEYDINADDFCTKEYGQPRIRIYAP